MRLQRYTNDDGLRDFFSRDTDREPMPLNVWSACLITAILAFSIGVVVGVFAIVIHPS